MKNQIPKTKETKLKKIIKEWRKNCDVKLSRTPVSEFNRNIELAKVKEECRKQRKNFL